MIDTTHIPRAAAKPRRDPKETILDLYYMMCYEQRDQAKWEEGWKRIHEIPLG